MLGIQYYRVVPLMVGGGGTDFRPAFARIAQLRQDGALRDLQGVLYFTDGKGIRCV